LHRRKKSRNHWTPRNTFEGICLFFKGEGDAMSEGKNYTLRDLAEKYALRRHQVDYAIREYGITPDAKIGNINLWAESSLPGIEAALRRVAERRGASNA
jgi:hypothetical protein